MKNEYVEYTSVDDLIKELQDISKRGYGDYPVCVNGTSPIHVSSRPYYYDGGYIVRDINGDNYNFLRSRMRDESGKGLGMRPGVKETCFDLDICDATAYEKATIDGREVREMDVETWSFLDQKEQEEMAIFGGLVRYKLSPTVDEAMGCHPFTAYLDSGLSAIGHNMNEAKENLKKKAMPAA